MSNSMVKIYYCYLPFSPSSNSSSSLSSFPNNNFLINFCDTVKRVSCLYPVIDFYHGIGHRLLKASEIFDIKVIFRFPHKLSSLPISINGKEKQCQKAMSTHMQFRSCKKEVVYKIPLSCGAAYIGQTGKCVNARLTEHSREKENKNEAYKNLLNHTITCRCEPDFEKTQLIGTSGRSKIARELLEAYLIKNEIDTTISEASVKIIQEEFEILQSANKKWQSE